MAKAKPKKTTKPKTKKPTPQKPPKNPKELTPKERNFLRYRLIDGMTLEAAYGKAYKTKMTPNNRANEGWKLLQRLREKIGTWQDMMTMFDLGPDRLFKMLSEALEANGDKGLPDHRVRLQAGKEVMKIHGIGEENINVNVDVTAKDVSDNKPYIDMVAEVMQEFRKAQNESDDDKAS